MLSDGPTGKLSYDTNWTNQNNEVLVEESTRFEFSGTKHQRIIDRMTVLTATVNALLCRCERWSA